MVSFLHWCPIWQGDVCWSVSPVFFAASFFSILCLGVASIWLLFFRLHPYLCSTSSSQPFVFTQHCWLRWSCVINVLLEKTCGCWIHHMCCWSPIVCRFYPFVISSSTGTNRRLCVSIDEWFSDEHLVLFWWTIEARFCMRHAIPRCWSRAPGTSLRHGSFLLSRTPLAGQSVVLVGMIIIDASSWWNCHWILLSMIMFMMFHMFNASASEIAVNLP